jgi:hypothetical protein
MACGTSRGALTRLQIDGQQFRFVQAKNTSNNPSLIDLTQDTIRGTFQPHSNDILHGQRIHRWQITLQPTPLEFGVLLPLMGFTNSAGTTWVPTTNLQTNMDFMMEIDLVNEVLHYAVCKISKWVIQGQRGRSPWTVVLDIIADVETSTTWTAATAIGAGRPYAFHQATMSLAATDRSFYRAVLANDFHLEDEFYNSQTVTDLCPQTWDMTLATAVPFTADHEALYTGARDSLTRPAGVLTWTGTNISTTFTFPELVPLPKPPDILKRDESLKLGLFYRPVSTDAADLVTITHDSTA